MNTQLPDDSIIRPRAGRYQRQPGGYRAFIPNPLPPDPPIRIEGELQHLLSQADQALGRLDGAVSILPNVDLFAGMYARKEAVLSSRIEGTQSTLLDLLFVEADIRVPNRQEDAKEAANCVTAMRYGLKELQTLPLCKRLLLELHRHLMDGVRGNQKTPGEFRRSQNWIGPGGCRPDEAAFVPPPPDEVLPALDALERFLHDADDLPALVPIGLVHVQFETIHPFLDGNGRLGRLLITFMLCHQKILHQPVLYLSRYFDQHRSEYYGRLQAVRDNDDWEGWLVFFLKGVLEISEDATQTARDILNLREKYRQLVTDKMGRSAGNGHRILDRLYRQPLFKVAEIRQLLQVSYAGANNLVGRLEQLRIVREITGGKRHRFFCFEFYLKLFSDPEIQANHQEAVER